MRLFCSSPALCAQLLLSFELILLHLCQKTPRLVLQRPPGKANAGLWELPGGKLDEGETPEGALVRELREELGLEVIGTETHSCKAEYALCYKK
eukprot:scaffold45820_cov19-Tisochrysis_lutea.AAC.1